MILLTIATILALIIAIFAAYTASKNGTEIAVLKKEVSEIKNNQTEILKVVQTKNTK